MGTPNTDRCKTTENEIITQIVDARAKSLTDSVIARRIRKRKLLALETTWSAVVIARDLDENLLFAITNFLVL